MRGSSHNSVLWAHHTYGEEVGGGGEGGGHGCPHSPALGPVVLCSRWPGWSRLAGWGWRLEDMYAPVLDTDLAGERPMFGWHAKSWDGLTTEQLNQSLRPGGDCPAGDERHEGEALPRHARHAHPAAARCRKRPEWCAASAGSAALSTRTLCWPWRCAPPRAR